MNKKSKLVIFILLGIITGLIFKIYNDSIKIKELTTFTEKIHNKPSHIKMFLDAVEAGIELDVSVGLIELDNTNRYILNINSNSKGFIDIAQLEDYVNKTITEDECIQDTLAFGNNIIVNTTDITGKKLTLKGYSDRANKRSE